MPWAATRNTDGVVSVRNSSATPARQVAIAILHEFHSIDHRDEALAPGDTLAFVVPPGPIRVTISWSRSRLRRSRWSKTLA